MRCFCCNKALSNQESTRKFASGVYTDVCTPCLNTISDDVETIDSDVEENEDEQE